jgi:hypothetical protein
VLVFIEYLSRKHGVSLEEFHKAAHSERYQWASRFSEDTLILNVARTWWLGPKPDYVTVWYTPGSGLQRLDEWEQIAWSKVMAEEERSFLDACEVEMTGCFEPLIEPIGGAGDIYYGEYFEFVDGATRKDVLQLFNERKQRHPQLVLNLLADRIGPLGPNPRALAFWQLPTYAALEPLVGDLDETHAPIRVSSAGLYATVGREMPAPMFHSGEQRVDVPNG